MNGNGSQRKKHGEGNFSLQKHQASEIGFSDFGNIWTFTNLFRSSNDIVFKWLRDRNLMVDDMLCTQCSELCKMYKRVKNSDGYTFRCKNGHEYGIRKYSFFEGSSYNVRDLMVFIVRFLEGHTLLRCSKSANMDYKSTSVHWASYIRELFCQYVYTSYENIQFDGEVEIDESLFGRKIKYNRGNPSGTRIWIFGIVERATNRIILYPVDNRSSATLIPIIQKHVRPGSRIFSDSWAAYLGLNELGYEHFSVIHKTTFKQRYVNLLTGEEVACCTNRIEGAWKLAKDHFRAINGTNTKMFQQHLAEIIWRNHVHRSNIYEAFFHLMYSIYTLQGPPNFTYTKPLFKTWTPPSGQDEQTHNMTIIGGSDGESGSGTEENEVLPSIDQPDSASIDHSVPIVLGEKTPITVTKRKRREDGNFQQAGPSTVGPQEDIPGPTNSAIIDLTQEDQLETDDENVAKLFFPPNYKPFKKSGKIIKKIPKGSTTKGKSKGKGKGKGKAQTLPNPYSKSAFVWSDDDDFV